MSLLSGGVYSPRAVILCDSIIALIYLMIFLKTEMKLNNLFCSTFISECSVIIKNIYPSQITAEALRQYDSTVSDVHVAYVCPK